MSAPALSARGTRLNRRGLQTREHVLRSAVQHLAEGGPEAVSANAVVKRAGATWGTIRHQFGDVDGLWAAVLEHIALQADLGSVPVPTQPDVAGRVAAVVATMWRALDDPGASATYRLRGSLPTDRVELEAAFPHTARALARWETAWAGLWERSFAGLGIRPDKLLRVQHLLPGALHGIHDEQHLSTYIDAEEARRGLQDAISTYLAG